MQEKNEIKLKSKDNVKIAINFYNQGNEAVVIVAPGWCMTKDSKAFCEISEVFANDFDVITLDFRGHGKSGGFFTFGAKEIEDLTTVVDFAKEKYDKIYLAGFSLGASTSLIVAAQNDCVDKVIAVSAPSEFGKIENYMWKKAAWFETLRKFELSRFLTIRPSLIIHKKPKAIDFVDKITAPTLFIAGENDPTVYPWHTEKLFQKATCRKDYKLFKNGYHAEDLYLHFKDEFTKLCIDWLKN